MKKWKPTKILMRWRSRTTPAPLTGSSAEIQVDGALRIFPLVVSVLVRQRSWTQFKGTVQKKETRREWDVSEIKKKMLPASMAMRGERLVSEKAKQQVKDVKWNCKKIRDSSDCHPVQMSMPIIGRILFSSQSYLHVQLLLFDVPWSQFPNQDVRCMKHYVFGDLWLFMTNGGRYL